MAASDPATKATAATPYQILIFFLRISTKSRKIQALLFFDNLSIALVVFFIFILFFILLI